MFQHNTKSERPRRFSRAVVLAAAAVAAASIMATAQTSSGERALELTATLTEPSGSPDAEAQGNVKVALLRWSTDAERDKLNSAWTMPTAVGGGGPDLGAQAAALASYVDTTNVNNAEDLAAAVGVSAEDLAGFLNVKVSDLDAIVASLKNGKGKGKGKGPAGAPGGGNGAGAAKGFGGGAAKGPAGGFGGGGRGKGKGKGGPGGPAAPASPANSLGAALASAPTLGYVWPSSDPVGYAIKYAVQLDGGQRVILITNRRLGTTPHEFTPSNSPNGMPYDFSLLEFRLNGKGEGKASTPAPVAFEESASALALEDYSAAPVVFSDVNVR